jgi:winged helix DNA-binding protein
MTMISAEQVLRYRARASHLDRKLSIRSIARAAWGGLQDSVPRGGVLSLHARVRGTKPDSWEHPALVQIWFRGGADYIVPRADVGVFTLGCLPRDPARVAALEQLADRIHAAARGEMTPVGEVAEAIGHRSAADPLHPRVSSATGRVHIRWDASRIWLIPVERPAMDPEDARRELARRFLHWLGPAAPPDLARWTGASPADAKATWAAIEREIVPVELDAEVKDRRRYILEEDLAALRAAKPIEGVRLLPQDDPFTKRDHQLLLADADHRGRALATVGQSRGYIPGAIVVDGELVGSWQRQGRKVTLHPFRRLPARVRDAAEDEALSMPIAGDVAPRVAWD